MITCHNIKITIFTDFPDKLAPFSFMDNIIETRMLSLSSKQLVQPNVGLLLGHHLRRWTNSKPTLNQRLMFAGWWLTRDCEDVAAAGGIKAASCSRPGQASISRGTGTHGCQPLHYLPPQVPRTGCIRWLSAGPASVTLAQHSTNIWPTNVNPRESIHRR